MKYIFVFKDNVNVVYVFLKKLSSWMNKYILIYSCMHLINNLSTELNMICSFRLNLKT